MSIAWKLLSEGQRSGILSVCSPNFNDVLELFNFVIHFIEHEFEAGLKYIMCLNNCCDVNNSGETVVTRLTLINVIIRMHWFISDGPS